MVHMFEGKWISNRMMAELTPRNIFHRQLQPLPLDCSKHRNQHILFRKSFVLVSRPSKAKLYISADDYYKLYVNGRFVAQGPSPSYHFQYNYNEVDVTDYLQEGENLLAVHTLYQGLINRVWQSGDQRHGLLCDLIADGITLLSSDESFLVSEHTGYAEIGTCGYDTQFLESYDSRAAEVGFQYPGYDDSQWLQARLCLHDDHVMAEQKSHMLVFEEKLPCHTRVQDNRITHDFGSNYVGYLAVTASGQAGDQIIIRCAQELNEDGSLRYRIRANCVYEETWTLTDGCCELDQFDYKAFRYVELELPPSVRVMHVGLKARHYPFELKTSMKPAYANDEDMRKIWDLCINTQKYGVQEVIQDCMEREKGFYLGDGCYTALTHMVLTGDDSMVRKLIDDAFATKFITDTLVTCMDCSFMQEIAEYPLMLVYLVLWHYNYIHDLNYLRTNYGKVILLLDAYRREYETDYLLKNLNKWCVVEWPMNFRHGYDVDIREGKICEMAHISLNAYYLHAIRTANHMASLLGLEPYRDEAPIKRAFYSAFYDPNLKLFKDGEHTGHVSLVGNSFAFAFGLEPEAEAVEQMMALYDRHGIHSLSMFCTFPMLMGFVRHGDDRRLKEALLNDESWRRMLREDATTTFEGWGKDTKWNTSLFHLTMSYGALFMADIDLKTLLGDF